MSVPTSFDDELGVALAAPVGGWSFDWLTGRAVGAEPSWSYPALAAPLVAGSGALLDLDTGGGELLASLAAGVGLPATPDFTAERYDLALRRIHRVIVADGHLAVHSHRFLIRAHSR